MKRTLLLVMLALLLCLSLALFSCGKKGDDKNPSEGSGTVTPTPDPTPEDPTPEDPTPEDPTPEDPTLKNFSGITFNSLTTIYNGEEQKIEISGELPEGTTVSYTSNKATDAGTYSAKATLSCEGYNTKTLEATLTINKATYDMSGAKWSDTTEFTYDTTKKTVTVSGLPTGVSVKSYNGNTATDAGAYTATVTFDYDTKNYNAPTLASCSWNINKATYDMSGAKWSDTTEFTYDTTEKTVTVSGLPTGVSVKSYNGNTATDAGAYTATVTFEYDTKNYNAPTLASCSWNINKAQITVTVELPSESFEYDAKPHSLAIVGNIPAGTTVSYTYNGKAVSEVTEVGKYDVVATISGKNYITLTIEATLTISSTEKLLYAINHNGTIYFQNDLDGAKLYKVDSTGKITKVNNDTPEYFFSTGSDLYYYSSSLFSKVIKKIDSEGNVTNVCTVKGEYITTDGKYVYYAVNNLLIGTDENGIYRIDPSATTPVAERISTNKAAYLCVEGGVLYYSNLTDGKKLYSLNLSSYQTKCIHEEKVEYIIADKGFLYFDSTKTASAIYKYDIAQQKASKMTTDSGKYLTKVGDYIYYVNNDLLTSTLFGDGIYKVSISTTGSLPGSKVISEDGNGYSSLTSDGKYLYYYKLNDKHFYRYDPVNNTELDLMASFVPPVEEIILAGEAVIGEYKGEIYYTNPLDGNLYGACLYKYNPNTKSRVKVLADNVSAFWFHNDYLYYTTCWLTNYALFRMDMTTGTIEKINADRCESLIFDGDDIYYLKVDLLTKNKIMKISEKDIFAEPVVIYDDKNISLNGIYKDGNNLYFVYNPMVGYQKLYKLTIGQSKAEDLGSKAFFVIPYGDLLYFYDDTANAIKSCNTDGSKVSTVISNVEINDLYCYDGKLYYSSLSKTVGVYSYDIKTATVTKIYDKVGEGLVMIDGKLWFLQTAVTYVADYPAHSGEGSGKLCCYDGKDVSAK